MFCKDFGFGACFPRQPQNTWTDAAAGLKFFIRNSHILYLSKCVFPGPHSIVLNHTPENYQSHLLTSGFLNRKHAFLSLSSSWFRTAFCFVVLYFYLFKLFEGLACSGMFLPLEKGPWDNLLYYTHPLHVCLYCSENIDKVSPYYYKCFSSGFFLHIIEMEKATFKCSKGCVTQV